MFNEDLISESLGCCCWKEKLEVEDSTRATLHILDNFSHITKEDIKKANFTRNNELQGLSMNMYISLWKSLSTISKTIMLSHKSVIGTDGPVL